MGKATVEDIVKLLAILGGLIAIIEAILSIVGRSYHKFYHFNWAAIIITAIIAIIFAILVLLAALKPGNPIPYHWLLLVIFGIILIVCGSIIGGILVLIAGILKVIVEGT